MLAPMTWNRLKDSRSEPRRGKNTMTIHQPSQNPNRKLIETMTIRAPRNSNKINKGSGLMIQPSKVKEPEANRFLIGNDYD
jgi:hypothetical protein